MILPRFSFEVGSFAYPVVFSTLACHIPRFGKVVFGINKLINKS